MDAWIRDARLAVRGILRTPRQSAFVLLVLALALGGNAALFTLLDALVLRPLPVPGAERLVIISAHDARGQSRLIPLTTIAALERRQHSFEAMGGYTSPGVFAGEVRGAAVPISLETMAGDFYDLLGVTPAAGRLLTHDESMPGPPAPAVAVISHDYWQREFQGDPAVVGQHIRIASVPITIVGVTPPTFKGLYREARYWRHGAAADHLALRSGRRSEIRRADRQHRREAAERGESRDRGSRTAVDLAGGARRLDAGLGRRRRTRADPV